MNSLLESTIEEELDFDLTYEEAVKIFVNEIAIVMDDEQLETFKRYDVQKFELDEMLETVVRKASIRTEMKLAAQEN
ncbi:hypothetical protein WKH56_20275 [Priestia sp. SB1]|uniref:hypothetical protein n=1 Tax=Priestia TaxID=2800373 RepID=UPI002877EC9A|nr:hypothetical protein [Priestia megaterium]